MSYLYESLLIGKPILKTVLDGDYLKSLDNIKQWQEKDVFKEESVSQHSYKVVVFCRILLEELLSIPKQHPHYARALQFKLECVDRAIFHDWDETLIRRDISHETKYNNFNGSKIRDVLDELVEHLVNEQFDIRDDNGFFIPSSELLVNSILFPYDDVKLFVKLADWLALYFYIAREKSIGNKGLEVQFERCKAAIQETYMKVLEMLKVKFEITI